MDFGLLARHAAVACAVALLAGCASPQPPVGPNPASFSVPFSYPAFGAGPQPVSGELQLREGGEQEAVGRAIVAALQGLQLSVVEPTLRAADTLPAGRPWKTDVASIAADDVIEHNRRNPAAPLPVDRIYGIQYSGEYAVLARELRFRLQAVLHQRGAASAFRPYEQEYSGQYFFDRIRARIEQALQPTGRPPQP